MLPNRANHQTVLSVKYQPKYDYYETLSGYWPQKPTYQY